MIELVLHPQLLSRLRAIDRLEIELHRATRKCLATQGQVTAEKELDGGSAFYMGPGHFFTQVLGMGYPNDRPVDEKALLDQLEAFFAAWNEPTYIELNLAARLDLFAELARRHYEPIEQSYILWAEIERLSLDYTQPKDWAIRPYAGENSDSEAVLAAIIEGFGLPVNEANQQFQRTYYQAAGMRVWGAYCQGIPAGGGSLYCSGEWAYLSGASITAAYRGQGAHKALILERLAQARQQGARYACVVTPTASVSQYNMEQLGFRVLGARTKYAPIPAST